jgi:hypothetical protein
VGWIDGLRLVQKAQQGQAQNQQGTQQALLLLLLLLPLLRRWGMH